MKTYKGYTPGTFTARELFVLFLQETGEIDMSGDVFQKAMTTVDVRFSYLLRTVRSKVFE